MTKSGSKSRAPQGATSSSVASDLFSLDAEYFRVRDFEYVQPLYDLAFLLEVSALANGGEIPKYRTFSLWRAGYSLDGYGTSVDRWLDGSARDEDLDFVPSSRIREYLENIRLTGTLPELRPFRNERYERCLRLRSVRGLGPSKIALTLSKRSLDEDWFNEAAIDLALSRDRITELHRGRNQGPWQTAHIVPPLLRFLRAIEEASGRHIRWSISGVNDPFEPVIDPLIIGTNATQNVIEASLASVLRRQKHFHRGTATNGAVHVAHQMGWSFVVQLATETESLESIEELARRLDPISINSPRELLSDLHLHTAWSDGSASVNAMASAVMSQGLKYFAVTDHSRSSKLQGGLTPPLWLRQANALTLAMPVCPVLHGVEVDILKDGSLDLPASLLLAADLVVASVHSNWSEDIATNTDRLLRAIESGCIDVLAHPTSAIIGKPGVPDYLRPPAPVDWGEVFSKCAEWYVAVELNCFPSRLDLPPKLLQQAVSVGCAISIGSDAHARSHLLNLRFGEAALKRVSAPTVLNRFSYKEIKCWIQDCRNRRQKLIKTSSTATQTEFSFGAGTAAQDKIFEASIQPPHKVPDGSPVIGLDLTAGEKPTGVATLVGHEVHTCSLTSDREILAYIEETRPAIVSIDSPLGLPGGGPSISPAAGIVRVAEYDLASVGIPAYPALIDSMRNLTLRGIRLREEISKVSCAPRVIESYPGAAQDLLCIPRKQKSLHLLKEGLSRLGLYGRGLETRSHDEMDAITAAIVGRYFESGSFERMGIPSEAELIVPRIRPLLFRSNPVICVAGKTGAGKSVLARYLSLFYGFDWIRTRDVIRELLVDDMLKPKAKRLFDRNIAPTDISELDLRDFGALILDKYGQAPLREKLTHMVVRSNAPTVVDSIRGVGDVDQAVLGSRPIVLWFVECSDTILRERIAKKSKMGEKRPAAPTPVDKTAAQIRSAADQIVANMGSLEELRWRVDNTLFASTRLQR